VVSDRSPLFQTGHVCEIFRASGGNLVLDECVATDDVNRPLLDLDVDA
jgi:hypothetical protein